jgi:hypothetical protein
MSDEQLVAVSPQHSVFLASELCALFERAPRQDFVVRTLTKRMAGSLPLMAAELVIAGVETRESYPLAATYPLHFRKTYFPGRMHGDPKEEYECQATAAELLGLPPPIGHSPNSFRSCLLPGEPYSRHSPFGGAPEDRNIWKAREVPMPSAAGLWQFVASAIDQIRRLQDAGISHGDAELHNFIVCSSPLAVFPIDFEGAARREQLDAETWEKRLRTDLEPLLREAVYLQCALGRQQSPAADLAWERLDALLPEPDRFREAIEQRSNHQR